MFGREGPGWGLGLRVNNWVFVFGKGRGNQEGISNKAHPDAR